MEYVQWRQADEIGVHIRVHKEEQDQIGVDRACTPNKTNRPRTGYRASGDPVALIVELMSCHSMSTDVKVLTNSQAFRALRDI